MAQIQFSLVKKIKIGRPERSLKTVTTITITSIVIDFFFIISNILLKHLFKYVNA